MTRTELSTLLIASNWKLSVVPAAIFPVFVTVNDGSASNPVLHPEMNPPAIARTSWGRRGKSNDVGIAVPSLRTLSIVWWRASMVTIEAASVRTTGSEMKCAAPRYAPTPTFSTRRATGAMALTEVRTEEKSKLHPEMAESPLDSIALSDSVCA